jgi:hypothetical protein
VALMVPLRENAVVSLSNSHVQCSAYCVLDGHGGGGSVGFACDGV